MLAAWGERQKGLKNMDRVKVITYKGDGERCVRNLIKFQEITLDRRSGYQV